MDKMEAVEAAVLERLRAGEELPKTIMNWLQQRPDVTRAEASEAIWRLVASHRVQLTKSLRLRAEDANARASA